MTTYIICTRCGKRMRPLDTVGTGTEPTIGYCACKPQTGWGYPAPMTPLLDWRDAELARLRAALAEAERERDEAVGRLNKAVIDIAHGATEAVKWEKRAREAERKLSVSETLRAAASQSGNEVAKSTLDYYAMEKRKARTYEKLAATYAAIASRQRRTIRALVVAGRGMYYAIVRALVGWGVPPSDKLTKQATMRIKYGIMRTREDGKE